MKPETIIYEKIKPIIPEVSEKTIFFAAISKTSYEVFFYAFIDGNPKQCFELAENGVLDLIELDSTFESMVSVIKELKVFKDDKCNVVTITVDASGMKMDLEYYEKDARMYHIKKEWKNLHINP